MQCDSRNLAQHDTSAEETARGVSLKLWFREQINYCSKAAAQKLNNVDYPQVDFRSEELMLGLVQG